MSVWTRIEAMLHAIGVGYLGAGAYVVLVVLVFWWIGRKGGGNGKG